MDSSSFLSLITSQHRSQPKFNAAVRVSIEPIIDVINCLQSMNGHFDLATATGDQLQIIADWVGAPNAIPNAIPIPFFGFDDQDGSLPFGELDDSTVGGYWRESGMNDSTAKAMDTDLFRKVIYAKIFLNQSDCSEQSAIDILSLILTKKFKFVDNLDMSITFTFLDTYEVWERELVRMMFPLPSGVKLRFEGENEY
ncbi:DUF2612 domain-containing protein [Acinetobacter rathckeae]|uniref:DUF2612 domain-containing protein n=1 Tax=Acinetobacter rathckeae TaxID=2605272 RepID=UPI0018A28312|nr:DUF2612 domain-containing protein [Acinetobacter rathckeae]MBF7687092.1 DUF2612 domain-containing protein [Acinetobacter rathckeae]